MKRLLWGFVFGMVMPGAIAWAFPVDIASEAGTSELRAKLVDRDNSSETDGIVFWRDEKGNQGAYPLDDYTPQKPSLPNYKELIKNNKKLPIEQHVSEDLLERIKKLQIMMKLKSSCCSWMMCLFLNSRHIMKMNRIHLCLI